MEHNTQTKSQLAKLMATENILVEHAKVSTASFNLKTRKLLCPIWKDMSGDLYDLLMGHEVGHALETPLEGWHDSLCKEGNKFKSFLNVIEDARIEKKIKRRYPGLRSSFVKAYTELLKKDFFGINGKDINQLFLIDRINLYFKCGSGVTIDFKPKEQKFIDMILVAETWDDTVRIAKELFEYSKEEQQENQDQQQNQSPNSDSDDSEFDEYEQDEDDFQESDETETESGKMDSDEDSEEEEDDSKEKTEFDDSTDENQQPKESFEPECKTDENFRANENSLLDPSSQEYVYINLPKAYISNIITPAKEANDIITKHFTMYPDRYSTAPNVEQFKKTNSRYVSMLAKEFEMKKAASLYSKRKVSDTGDIDISKIFKYKFDDTIFRKAMTLPKGKSHGFVMLLDKSGSMENSLHGAIEQILVLAMFCRKVNIPFVAYSFNSTFPRPNSFSQNNSDLKLMNFNLREMISSKMPANEFARSIKNQLQLGVSKYVPNQESLGSTPLIEALVASKDIILDLKKKHNLEMVNLIVVHDGDADRRIFTVDGRRCDPIQNNVVLQDKINKIDITLPKTSRGMTVGVMKMITKLTGAKIMGMYISGSGWSTVRSAIFNYYCSKNGEILRTGAYMKAAAFAESRQKATELSQQLRKEKFLESYTEGYTRFFFLPGGSDLKTEDDEIGDIKGDVTASKLTTAFKKFNKTKHVSRVMVSKFIEMIAK